MPFEDSWSTNEKRRATHAFLKEIMRQLGLDEPQQQAEVRRFLGRLEGTSRNNELACLMQSYEVCEPDSASIEQRRVFEASASEWAEVVNGDNFCAIRITGTTRRTQLLVQINLIPLAGGGRRAVREAVQEVLANSFVSTLPQSPVASELAEWFRLCWRLQDD